MNRISRISLVFSLALASVLGLSAQTALTQTTLSSAALSTDNIINVTSATGISAPAPGVTATQLYVIAPGNPRGEVMLVQAVSSTAITVARGRQGARTAFPSGSRVLIGNPNYFKDYEPSGGCTTAATTYTPWVTTRTGLQWLCSTITLSWVPGWGNTTAPIASTASVASAAGAILPSGPLFTVSGTSAITGFTIPVGFVSGCFTTIPTGAFTWTTAGNIGLAGTAVVGRALTFCWHDTGAKFYPSYV